MGAYRRWLNATARRLKSKAPRTLVTTGTEGLTPFPREYVGIDFAVDHASDHVDYATVHVWPQNWGWYDPERPETYDDALNKSVTYIRRHVDLAREIGKPLVLEEFGIGRDAASHRDGTPVTTRDRYYADVFAEVLAHATDVHSPLHSANFWAWGGEGRPRSPRARGAPLTGEHCWQPGDPLLGDPPHEPAGWYSVFDTDTRTHAVVANFSAELGTLPLDY